jgi:WD40 repeat protein
LGIKTGQKKASLVAALAAAATAGASPALECAAEASPTPQRSRSAADASARLTTLGAFAEAVDDFAPSTALHNNFLKGFSFSPDGTCILTASEDAVLRVYETPADAAVATQRRLRAAIWAKEGETVFDARWYPLMRASTPASCCFASTSRDHPIHLWDAYTGALRASYLGYDNYDALTAAVSLAFSPRGRIMIGGYERMVRVFDLTRPGRATSERPTRKRRRRAAGQCGLIGALAFSEAYPVYCAGSYLGGASIYSEDNGELVCRLDGAPRSSGVTQVQFAANGTLLFAGTRRDAQIVCWDTRRPDAPLRTLRRAGGTNQRLGFDVNAAGTRLITGTSAAHALLFDDLRLGEEDATERDGGGGGDGGGSGDAHASAQRLSIAGVDATVHCARFCPTLESAGGGLSAVVAFATGARVVEGAGGDDTSSSDSDAEGGGAEVAAAAPPRRPQPRPQNGVYFAQLGPSNE